MPALSSLAIAGLAVMATTAAYQGYAQSEAAGDQKDAQNKARQQAENAAKAQEEATNRANQKKPDTSAIMSAAMQASKGGVGSTMLTGPGGAGTGQLGGTSLLGG